MHATSTRFHEKTMQSNMNSIQQQQQQQQVNLPLNCTDGWFANEPMNELFAREMTYGKRYRDAMQTQCIDCNQCANDNMDSNSWELSTSK